MWGTDANAPGDGLLPDRILGVRLTSPPIAYGTDTGFIDEKAISFDPLPLDGGNPLDPAEEPTGPLPQRPGGVIGKISDGIDAESARPARTELARALDSLGVISAQIDQDLSTYADAAGTAFTAEPMLVPVG
nr:hypothetical protein [Streptomyces sp. SID5468]